MNLETIFSSDIGTITKLDVREYKLKCSVHEPEVMSPKPGRAESLGCVVRSNLAHLKTSHPLS